MPHLRREEVSRQTPVHVAWVAADDIGSLRAAPTLAAVRAALAAVAEARPQVRFLGQSITDARIDLLVEAPDVDELVLALQALGIRIARGVNRALGHRGRVLGDRYESWVLRDRREVDELSRTLAPMPSASAGTRSSRRA